MTWIIKKAGGGDAIDVGRLLRELAAELSTSLPASPALERFLESEIRSTGRCFLLAYADRVPAGVCGIRFSPCLWTQRTSAEVLELVVRSDQRGRGCGRALVAAAEQEARGRGCSHLSVLTERWNGPARDFYRRLGLTEKECSYFEMGLRGRTAGGREAPPAGPVTAS